MLGASPWFTSFPDVVLLENWTSWSVDVMGEQHQVFSWPFHHVPRSYTACCSNYWRPSKSTDRSDSFQAGLSESWRACCWMLVVGLEWRSQTCWGNVSHVILYQIENGEEEKQRKRMKIKWIQYYSDAFYSWQRQHRKGKGSIEGLAVIRLRRYFVGPYHESWVQWNTTLEIPF